MANTEAKGVVLDFKATNNEGSMLRYIPVFEDNTRIGVLYVSDKTQTINGVTFREGELMFGTDSLGSVDYLSRISIINGAFPILRLEVKDRYEVVEVSL